MRELCINELQQPYYDEHTLDIIPEYILLTPSVCLCMCAIGKFDAVLLHTYGVSVADLGGFGGFDRTPLWAAPSCKKY